MTASSSVRCRCSAASRRRRDSSPCTSRRSSSCLSLLSTPPRTSAALLMWPLRATAVQRPSLGLRGAALWPCAPPHNFHLSRMRSTGRGSVGVTQERARSSSAAARCPLVPRAANLGPRARPLLPLRTPPLAPPPRAAAPTTTPTSSTSGSLLGQPVAPVPHAGYHYDGTPRRFFEGWYWKVTDPETGDSFALIYSVEDPGAAAADAAPGAGSVLGTSGQAELQAPHQGVGVQVMGPDGYCCQFSRDTRSFWANAHRLELGATLRPKLNVVPTRIVDQVRSLPEGMRAMRGGQWGAQGGVRCARARSHAIAVARVCAPAHAHILAGRVRALRGARLPGQRHAAAGLHPGAGGRRRRCALPLAPHPREWPPGRTRAHPCPAPAAAHGRRPGPVHCACVLLEPHHPARLWLGPLLARPVVPSGPAGGRRQQPSQRAGGWGGSRGRRRRRTAAGHGGLAERAAGV